MENTLTLTCRTCGASETFSTPKKFMLIQSLDRSMWHAEVDSIGTHTCATCHGSAMGFAAYNAMHYERQRKEEAAARKAMKASHA